jgi:hypothetical protein
MVELLMPNLKKVIGYGWCGLYSGEDEPGLGWLVSPFIYDKHSANLSEEQRMALGLIENTQYANSDMYRVKVTIEVVRNKKTGKPIVRRAKRA